MKTIAATRKLATLAALGGCALLAWAAPAASAAPPTVKTKFATGISGAAATLNATVKTAIALTDCRFEYVTSAAWRASVGAGADGFADLGSGGSVPCEPAAGSIPADNAEHEVSATIARPDPETQLRYQIVAANADGSADGADSGFDLPLVEFDGEVLQANGDPATQAGSRPAKASTIFSFPWLAEGSGFSAKAYPTAALRDAAVQLPPGLVGNPQGVPSCTMVQFTGHACPVESQVGSADLLLGGGLSFFGVPSGGKVAVYNLETPHGRPALFGFSVLSSNTLIYPELRTGDDYGLTMVSKNAPEIFPVVSVGFNFWGVPADPANDPERFCLGKGAANGFPGCSVEPTPPPQPFLALPTSCVGAVETSIEVTSFGGAADRASFLSHDNTEPVPNPIGADGCNAVPFEPTIEARPTTNVADSPSGLDVNLHVPQTEECVPGPPISCETTSAHLRDVTVELPEGLSLNPASANGLEGCSESEFGYEGTDPAGMIHTTPEASDCPKASRLADVTVKTPLLESPMPGSVYLAKPHDNPFDSLIALYLEVDDEKTGLIVKLAGEVELDSGGQVSATFQQNPQLPFEDFELEFFGGAGGSLRTPAVCGDHTATSTLVPWTAPEGTPANPSDVWQITQGPNGTACVTSEAAKPHSPSFDAGTVSPIAGANTPMVVNLRREDGSQEFSDVTVTPPPGLVGKLAGIPYCPDSALAAAASRSGKQETASPSCPAASRVGTVHVAAGAGPAPYWTQGTAYLTGPYKGAPVGLGIITPATAGPFDLGTVVTRVALHVDPVSAQITADSDPLPQILQGIPLDIRQALIRLDRPSFTLTGTSCDPLAFSGQLVSTLGAIAPLSERYQLGECSGLPFKPRMGLRLKGGTKRTAHPKLIANVRPAPGEANIAYARVKLPNGVLLDQAHIGTVCTRVQFAANQCPPASVYGRATATTPLLDYPLSGPVYLRSSSNKLPDLVAALRGPAHQPIAVELSGITDSVKGALRNTFQSAPDAPVTSFRLELFGGNRGLVTLGRNVCVKPRKRNRARIELEGHNGKVRDFNPVVRAQCKKRKRKRRAKRSSHRRAAVLKLRAVR